METAGGLESDKKDILDRIETLKTQIKDFEKELGIGNEDIMMLAPLDHDDFMGRLREPVHVRTGTNNSVVSSKSQAPTEPVKNSITPVAMEDRVRVLKEQVQQVQEMSQLLSKLKSGLSETQAKPKQPDVEHPPAVQKPVQDKMEPAQNFSKDDVPSLTLLIKRLNDLIKTNSIISGELREIIDDTKNLNKSARISDLVKKLAAIGING